MNYSNVDTLINQIKIALKYFLVNSLNLRYEQMMLLLNMKLHLQQNKQIAI